MIWGISCLQFCKKTADHKEGNTCSELPIIGETTILSVDLKNRFCAQLGSKRFWVVWDSNPWL